MAAVGHGPRCLQEHTSAQTSPCQVLELRVALSPPQVKLYEGRDMEVLLLRTGKYLLNGIRLFDINALPSGNYK